jgi:hypothetical protein
MYFWHLHKGQRAYTNKEFFIHDFVEAYSMSPLQALVLGEVMCEDNG